MKIKKIVNQITIPMLCISMEAGSMLPAYAAITENDTSTFEETGENVSKETEVLYEQSASYFVTIPKTIFLGSDKQSQYAVKVEGDIPSDKQVYVSPIDNIADTEAVDFHMHDQNTKAPKDDVAATVTQNKFYWDFQDVLNGYEETNNHIAAEGLSSGTWKGIFDFEINMHTVEIEKLALTTDGDVTMGVNSTYQTNAYINGKKVNDAVEWSSDNENILVVNGMLETKAAAKVGDRAKITVLAENSPSAYSLEDTAGNDMLSASFNVTVIDIAFTDEKTGEEVSSLDINPSESGTIKACIIPDSIEGTIKWSTTAAAGLNLIPNGNSVTIKAAEDMPIGSTYEVIATYGTYSKILKVNIPSDHDHNYVSEVTKEATYTEAGENTITCTICNESHTEEIPMLKDNNPATGSISISDNVWKNFLNTITFDIFFKETQNVVIEAEDKESGVKEISYYLAAGQVEEEGLSSLEWTTYDGKLTISPNEQYVIYARITDKQDNVTYINSNGMVLDNIAPMIEGLEDGGTYDPGKSIAIEDGDTLKVNGEEVAIKDNSYTFKEEGEYTVSVSDKAGNETSITITIACEHNYVNGKCTKCGKEDPFATFVTLRTANNGSDFFGNTDVVKSRVTWVTMSDSASGHYLSDANCWDVSDAQDGSILAWYTHETVNDTYHVWIAPKNEGDIIRAPKDASGLFSGMKVDGRDDLVRISGLEKIDFSQTTNFGGLFSGTRLSGLEVGQAIKNMDFSSAEYMNNMFYSTGYRNSAYVAYGLTSISLPTDMNVSNLKNADGMFGNIASLTSADIGNMPFISDSMFFFDYNLQTVTMGNITSIGENAFSQCTSLKNLVIPDSVEYIGDNAFYNVPLVVLPCKFDGSDFGAKAVEYSHHYAEEVVKAATCTEVGEKRYTCKDCGHSYTEEIEVLEHDYKETVIKEATCIETGEKKYTCNDCGYSYTAEIEMSEHNYIDNICTECGKKNLYPIAPEGEQDNYSYVLNEDNNTIRLTTYKGSDEDVIVYANYIVGGKSYKTDLSTLSFSYKSDIKAIKFSNEIDTSNRTSMKSMFLGCTSLQSIEGLENFDTSNVTDMYGIFNNCSSLTRLDLSSFDTSKVTTMSYMFGNCKALNTLDLGDFDTSNVADMSSMFYNCYALTNLDLSSFDTRKATTMNGMFNYCSSLTNLDLSNFDTKNVTNMSKMFYGCTSLSNIYVGSAWTTANASTTNMFNNCGVSAVTYK